MKESITKFDLEAAFKALDEIDAPVTDKGLKANRPALNEIFSRKSKFDTLFEEYYDINNTDGLDNAKEAREAEVAKAKLARIEKIVDLDAESPDDLLTTYVGKYIIQCPQCMTLFYKNPEDVEESEEDSTTVNVNEVCQHCGNESGYTLIGKVGEAEPEDNNAEIPVEPELPEDETLDTEASTEESTEEASDDLNFDLDAIDLEAEPVEEEETKKEESFMTHDGNVLVEELADETDLDAKLEAHNEYIEYLRTMISQEEEAFEKADNEQIKAAIQRCLDSFKEDLENALPEAVKNGEALSDEIAEEAQVEVEETFEKQEEAYSESTTNKALTEALTEETELETSAEDFEKLISSPEFKKPISDGEVRAMMDEFNDENEESKPDIKESVEVNNETLEYAVINPDGTFAGAPCASLEEAQELAAQKEGRVIVKLDEADLEALTEGGLGLLGKTIGKKLGQIGKGIKNKVSSAIDKFADNTKTREEKADWVLTYALEEYVKEINVDSNGKLIPDEKGQKFQTFLVVGFKDYYSNGKPITMAPSFNNKSLVIGMPEAQERGTYREADDLAKGWSTRQGCGPAFIYMAKNKKDTKAVFLCEYFKGELAYDQLEKYFEVVKKDLEGKERIEKGGGVQETEPSEQKTEEVQASKIKQGDVLVLGKETAEVIEVSKSKFGENTLAIKVKTAEGATDVINVETSSKMSRIIASEANESLNVAPSTLEAIMESLDEIQEAQLENLVSESLIEAYKNVAGFRLTSCGYLNEKLTVNGTIVFVSGNTRKTTYTFTEALTNNEGKITFHGLNEKLGLDKQFIITGTVDKTSKTFITEAFGHTTSD